MERALRVAPPLPPPATGPSPRVDAVDREAAAAGLEALAGQIRDGATFHDASGAVVVLVSPDGVDVATFGDTGPCGLEWAREAVTDALVVCAIEPDADPLRVQELIDTWWQGRRDLEAARAAKEERFRLDHPYVCRSQQCTKRCKSEQGRRAHETAYHPHGLG